MTKATVDEGVQDIYADTLEELSPETLQKVFTQAERTCKFLPVPAELREMAGLWDGAEVDKAWTWVQEYLIHHGFDGHDYLRPALNAQQQKDCTVCGGAGFVEHESAKDTAYVVTGCVCRKGDKVPAPTIPARICYTLQALANSVREALEMILTAEVKYQGKIRADFNAAYKRAQIMQEER